MARFRNDLAIKYFIVASWISVVCLTLLIIIIIIIIIIMFYSVQNQCTDGPLASCASGQSTTYINYIKLASYILTGYNIRYTKLLQFVKVWWFWNFCTIETRT